MYSSTRKIPGSGNFRLPGYLTGTRVHEYLKYPVKINSPSLYTVASKNICTSFAVQ